MADFSFRIRFRVLGTRLSIDTPNWAFAYPGTAQVVQLISQTEEIPISKADGLVLRGSGWPNKESAAIAGERTCLALALAFAELGIGADYGRRGNGTQFFTSSLESLSPSQGGKLLPDEHGLMVFETEPPPRFIRLFAPTVIVGTRPEKLARLLPRAYEHTEPFSVKEKLTLDLYHVAFFETSVAARFLTLVMATEVLLDPRPKSDVAVQHVASLMDFTRAAMHLSHDERNSLLSTLGWMRTESIGQAGRRLARERLGERQYNGLTAPKFFTHFYDLPSKMVHGVVPPPSSQDIGDVVPPLQMFVRDLLVGASLDTLEEMDTHTKTQSRGETG